jgi:hypothetical protein
LIGKCFFPIVVWQLIPSFWSIISITYRVVLTVGICAVLLYLKLYLLFFKVTRSCRYFDKCYKCNWYYASKTWNELPDHYRKETFSNQFKSLINSWNGSSCHCSFCAWVLNWGCMIINITFYWHTQLKKTHSFSIWVQDVS